MDRPTLELASRAARQLAQLEAMDKPPYLLSVGGGLVANQPRRQPSLGASGLVGCLPLRGSIRVGWLSWCDKAMCSSSPATCSRYLTSFNQMAILYNKVL